MLSQLLIAALLLPASAAEEVVPQASIQGFGPAEGTRGTVITVTGEHFGEKRPRAWLVEQASGKKRRLRVSEWTETELTAQVRAAKLPAGPYALWVDPRGKDTLPVEAVAMFEARAPSLERFDPTWVADETEITLIGEHFGSLRKPRVKVGGKRARVLEWSDTSLLIRRHKKLTGDATVSITTAAGTSDGPCPLYIHGANCTIPEGSPVPKLSCPVAGASAIFVSVDGWPNWSAGANLQVDLMSEPEDDAETPTLLVKVGGLDDPSGHSGALLLTFELDPDDDLTPMNSAHLLEARYAVFESPTKTLTWVGDGKEGDALTAEWSTQHCFSYAHAVADLRAVKDNLPAMIRINVLLRLDTMELLSDG